MCIRDSIKAYKTHFNAAYADLKAKVAATYSRSKAATDPNIVGVFSQGVATGVAQAASWSEHVQTQPIQFDAEAALIALTELQTFVVALCQKKQTSPAEPIGSITCLLYTSDAADERSSVDLGGRRIIKKKNKYKISGLQD